MLQGALAHRASSRLTPDAPRLWSGHERSHEARSEPRRRRRRATSAMTCRFALIAGPCALESRAHALETAEALKEIAGKAQASASSIRAPSTRRTAPAREAPAGWGSTRRCRSSPRSGRRIGLPVSPTCMSPTMRAPWPKRSTFCRSRPSSAARPISSLPRRAPARRSTSRRASSSRPGT